MEDPAAHWCLQAGPQPGCLATCVTPEMHSKVPSSRAQGGHRGPAQPPRLPGIKRTLGKRPVEEKGPSPGQLLRVAGVGDSQLPARNTGPSEAAKQGRGRLAGPGLHNPCFVPRPPPSPASILSRVRGSRPAAPLGQGLRQLGRAWSGPGTSGQAHRGPAPACHLVLGRFGHPQVTGRLTGHGTGEGHRSFCRGQLTFHTQDFPQRPGQHSDPRTQNSQGPSLPRDPGAP